MFFRIEMSMDNAAFEDNHGAEAARILRRLADQIDGDRYFDAGNERHLFDLNGNNVGFAGVYAKKPHRNDYGFAQGDPISKLA